MTQLVLSRVRRVGLGDVSIGMDRMAAAGEPVQVTPYPDGEPGIQQSIGLVCAKIRDGRIDTAVRGWAGDALIAAGSPSTTRGKAEAILNAVWAQTVYAPDPAGAEFIQSAATTLCLRPGLCIRACDCDDLCVVTGSALSSINIPVMVVRQIFGDGIQQHVLLAAQDDNGTWFYVDPTARNRPMGWASAAEKEDWYDPLEGVKGAVLVGVGAGWFRHERNEIVSVSDGSIGLGAVPMRTHEQRGLTALPPFPPTPTQWVPVNLADVRAGGRYFFAIISDLSQSDLVAVLPDDWNPVESMTAGSSANAWRIQAIATRDAPDGPTKTITGPFGITKGTITYVALFVEAAAGAPGPAPAPIGNVPPAAPDPNAVPPPAPAPVAPSGFGVANVMLGAAVASIVAGVGLAAYRHRKLFRSRIYRKRRFA